jgi:outer membrane receptor protein involved in Fe transport
MYVFGISILLKYQGPRRASGQQKHQLVPAIRSIRHDLRENQSGVEHTGHGGCDRRHDRDGDRRKRKPPQDATGSFGDIVVTATKRSENVAKVPISITAFSGDQLKALGVTDTTQITQHVPGLQLNAWSPNVTIFNLRGISQNNFTDYLESPVAVYVDDAYMGSINGISGQLFDVQRVEVLRGPQGTLFGRNATGGLIQYVSNDASRADFNGYATGTYERFNRRTLEGAVGGSITSGLRFRVAGRVAKADGYITPAAALPGVFESDGQALGGENGWAVRGTVQADLGPTASWTCGTSIRRTITSPPAAIFDNCNRTTAIAPPMPPASRTAPAGSSTASPAKGQSRTSPTSPVSWIARSMSRASWPTIWAASS